MKITIAYYSKGGRTKAMAEKIAEGARAVAGTEVGVFAIDDIDLDFLAESDAFILGTPVYYASSVWQIKKWFDESKNISLAGKLGAVFATADYCQGGASNALTMLLTHMMVKGMIVYSGGGAYGKPFIHQGAVALKDTLEKDSEMFPIFGKRIAEKAQELVAK